MTSRSSKDLEGDDLIGYLATLSSDDPTLAQAKKAAVRAIVELFRHPTLILCPWYDYAAVKQLENDAEYDIIHQLLKIFVSQGLDAYLEFHKENSEVLKNHGFVHEDCVKKMRLLSLIEISDVLDPKFNVVTFSLIQDTLQIDEDDVINWVTMAQEADLLECTIDGETKEMTVSRCKVRPSDISQWPAIRLQGKNWIEEYPELGHEVKDQRNNACYAHACAKAVGNLFSIEHGRPRVWKPACQELINRVGKAFPEAIDDTGYEEDETRTYPMDYTWCLEYVQKFGIPFERDCPYRIKRNPRISFPPGRTEYPRLYIKGYEWLGSANDGEKSKLRIFKAIYKSPLIGNIINVTKTFLDLKVEFYDDTIAVEPHAEGQMLENVVRAHTVLIVALDVSLRRMMILNSFGPAWGTNGTAWVNCNQLCDIARVYTSSIVEECPRPGLSRYELRRRDTTRKVTSSCMVGKSGASKEIFGGQSFNGEAGSEPYTPTSACTNYIAMSRRPASTSRRFTDGGSIPFVGSFHPKSRPSPVVSIGLVVVGAFLIVGYLYSGSGGSSADKEALMKLEAGASCSLEVLKAISILKKAYGDSMHKVLHVGPETCSVVSKLLKGDTEAWGVEPYDLDDADANCKSLVHKGIVRVADIKFPLPYSRNSFSLVIVSDALDYLSPKYLNKTLPELARVSADGIVVFSGFPGQRRAKVAELSKFGRPAKLRSSSWWIRYFVQTSLEENESVIKKFEQSAAKQSYNPGCQIFHLKSHK